MKPTFNRIAVDIDDEGICIITLNRPPANALDQESLQEIIDACTFADSSNEVRAVLLVSALPKIFSGGLDLPAMMAKLSQGDDEFLKYISFLSRGLCAPLYVNKPIACAVNGHAIAGGFIMACSCDYVAVRKGGKKFKLGATEAKIGVALPRGPLEAIRHHFGGDTRGFREICMMGRTYDQDKAFELGFGDVLVEDPVQAARDWLSEALDSQPAVFARIKRGVHYPFHAAMQTITTKASGIADMREQDRWVMKSIRGDEDNELIKSSL
eukprot:m.270944 g.270944  ORF g.270944 m.270944 type:complete len:268 (-) comp16265_c1_seq72:41-844(-)